MSLIDLIEWKLSLEAYLGSNCKNWKFWGSILNFNTLSGQLGGLIIKKRKFEGQLRVWLKKFKTKN